MSWSPDDKLLAPGGKDGVVRIWDSVAGEFPGELRGHSDAVAGVAWSPNGSMLASASHDFTIRLWSVPDLTEKSVPRGHANWVRSLSWSSDDQRVATVSDDSSLRVWLSEGKELFKTVGHASELPASILLGDDNDARVWLNQKMVYEFVGSRRDEPSPGSGG